MNKNKLQDSSYYFPYHYADLISDEFKNIKAIEYLEKIHTIISLLKVAKKDTLLDVGCGDGRLLYEATNRTKNIVGIDYSKRATDFAKAFNPNAEIITVDITKQKTKLKKCFSKITCIDVLEHLPRPQQKKMVSKLSELLTNRGTCLISVPSTNHLLIPKHYNHFTEGTLKELLSPHFQSIKIIGYLPKDARNKIRIMKAIGEIVYPYRQKVRWIDKYYQYVKQNLHDNFICDPKMGLGLFAICKKTKK